MTIRRSYPKDVFSRVPEMLRNNEGPVIATCLLTVEDFEDQAAQIFVGKFI